MPSGRLNSNECMQTGGGLDRNERQEISVAAKKYYAVRKGRVPGIYESWDACKKQVMGYSSASYKSFASREEAEVFMGSGVVAPKGAGEAEGEPAGEREPLVFSDAEVMTAYVDGSYNVKTKEFSYGMVILFQGEEKCFSGKVDSKDLASMRNVAGEIKGAEAAMRYALGQGVKKLLIYHDYEGIAKWCTGEWKANKEGTKAYQDFFHSLAGKLAVEFVKVKGHSNDKYNDMADALAKREIFP